MSETYAQFKEVVNSIAFPAGRADNLDRWFDTTVRVAIADLQRVLEKYRKKSRDVYPFCSTYFACGATVIAAPRARLQRVFTIENNCCPIFYDFVKDYDTFQNWLNSTRVGIMNWTEPANEGKPPLTGGMKFSESSLDKGRRFDWGRYTLHNDRLYLGVRIESSESVVLEYEGIKRNWKDGDLMPYDDADEGDANDPGTEFQNAVASYLRAEHFRVWERDLQSWQAELQNYNNLVAEMWHEDKREKLPKVQPEKEFNQLPVGPCVTTGVCASPSEETPYFAIIGDWGNPENGATMLDVQALVKGWSPSFVISTGDNRYGDYSYDELFAIADYYKEFVTAGLFFPTIGNHDTDDNDGITGFLAAFPYLPGDKRNWDLQIGHVHFFFRETHDSGSHAKTAAELALSAAQLRVRLAASQAPWKIVITQDGPYVSDTSNLNGHVASQLDYKGWGADLVVSGDSHFAEKLLIDGFPYLIEGGGGAVGTSPTTAIEGSLVRSATYGAIRGRATCGELVLERFDRAGNLIYTQTLEK